MLRRPSAAIRAESTSVIHPVSEGTAVGTSVALIVMSLVAVLLPAVPLAVDGPCCVGVPSTRHVTTAPSGMSAGDDQLTSLRPDGVTMVQACGPWLTPGGRPVAVHSAPVMLALPWFLQV
ncbi:hypothetical protein D3C71_1893330 [compost metagenome]